MANRRNVLHAVLISLAGLVGLTAVCGGGVWLLHDTFTCQVRQVRRKPSPRGAHTLVRSYTECFTEGFYTFAIESRDTRGEGERFYSIESHLDGFVFEWVGPATLSACWHARGWPPEPKEPLPHAAGGVQIEYAGPCP